jgi:DNA segregation ATPase FtsK/SpoIIIE-like protein
MWAHAVDAANSTQSGSYDMAFYDVLNLIREHNDASVAFVQRHTLFGYRRAKAILESMEGKYVTKPFSDGIRRVVIDPSLG